MAVISSVHNSTSNVNCAIIQFFVLSTTFIKISMMHIQNSVQVTIILLNVDVVPLTFRFSRLFEHSAPITQNIYQIATSNCSSEKCSMDSLHIDFLQHIRIDSNHHKHETKNRNGKIDLISIIFSAMISIQNLSSK